jgi:hypothetical protein
MPTFSNMRSGAHLLCERRSTQVELLFAEALTVRSGEGEKTAETGDNARVRTPISGGAKESRGAEASPLPSPAASSPSVVLRLRVLPYFATESS